MLEQSNLLDMTTMTLVKQTREMIEARMYNLDDDAERFVTFADLKEIWSTRYLEQFFNSFNLELSSEALKRIQKSIKVLSAFILVCDDPKTCGIFLKGLIALSPSLKDEHLPLQKECQVEGLTGTTLKYFVLRQYETLPTVIEESSGHMELQTYSGLRLPLELLERKVGIGAYGEVSKVCIPKEYHRKPDGYVNSNPMVFARKQLEMKRGETEVKNLRQLKDSFKSHSHIVTYQAIFIYGNFYNILYNFADIDLRKFLISEHYASCFDSTSGPRRILEEASNLSHALSFLHRELILPNLGPYICCHMDLKPDNILVYLQDDTFSFKIADLGISAMKRDPRSRSNFEDSNKESTLRGLTTKTLARRDSGEFEAPEMRRENKVGRSSDVWSMGCILLVMLIRTFGCIKALEEFNDKKSASDDYFYHENGIKEAVNVHLNSLDQHPSIHVSKLKKLVMKQDTAKHVIQLLVRMIRDCLQYSGKDRILSNELCVRLQEVSNDFPRFFDLLARLKCKDGDEGSRTITREGLDIYEKLFHSCTVGDEASPSLFWWHFRSHLDIRVIRNAWKLVCGNETSHLDIHHTSAAAFLIHLHLQKQIDLVRLDSSGVMKIDNRGTAIFKTFANWVTCNCDYCFGRIDMRKKGFEWNFSFPGGLWRGKDSAGRTRCMAFAFFESPSSQIAGYSRENFAELKKKWGD